ncbi:hypothetical protein Bca52824_063609 [Brassica carinata]|uniref:Uncharacterized protein n=1 Tax=Brassica carinata TaxID=52824 RepID=A0A8X7U8C3_BRACI|nr:hypothetical protein Bca52824_063609 [Brassica carinata]
MLFPMSPKKKRRNALRGSSKMARLQAASTPPASVHLLKKKSQIAGAECSVAEIVTEVAIESVLPCISEVEVTIQERIFSDVTGSSVPSSVSHSILTDSTPTTGEEVGVDCSTPKHSTLVLKGAPSGE